ncbi:hypothetical protein C5535_08415 [Campylobacter jejuni]|nr:hypothetical protein [Campylobacter jejuni]
MKKGEAKIEFYSNLSYLKKEFENGCVVSKFLYEKAKKERNFKMTYVQFNKYFNEIFKNQNTSKAVAKENKQEDNTKQNDKKEPVILEIKTNKGRVFDPLYGKNIDPSQILG